MLTPLAVFVGASFLAYGVSCLTSRWMRSEFERFGLARLRILIGALEVAGAVGVLAGLAVPEVGFLSAVGLTIVMAAAVVARRRAKDGLLPTLPSLIYLTLTAVLALLFALRSLSAP